MGLASGEPLYMGIDIESGKPGSPDARYSVAIIDSNGKLVLKSSEASITRIIRFAWEYRPEVIGTDNVFELARDIPKLHKLLNMLPPETKIIQVNVIEGQALPLRDLAKMANIEIESSKLAPMKTAYLVALLASKGYGTPVYMEEEKTIITVSKGRGSKKGGTSQQRYQRRVRASVLYAAKKVQEILDRAGIDYDVHFKGGRGGLDRAVFIVYAPRRKLHSLIKPHKGINYVIKFRTIYGRRLILGSPESRSERPIIVGIDPGIMVGIAILDLDGNVLYTGSGKSLDRGSLLEIITKYGRPVIIAVDTPEIPESVKAIAAKFQANIYAPSKPLLISEKIELAKQALGGRNPDTQHERDALASAYKALSNLQAKFSQIDAYLSKIDIDIDYDRVKEAVLKGSTLAEAVEAEISRILDESPSSEELKRVTRINMKLREEQNKIRSLLDRIEELTARLHVLEKKNRELTEEINEYKKELISCKTGSTFDFKSLKDQEIERLKNSIKLLNSELEKERQIINRLEKENKLLHDYLWKIARGDLVLARILQTLTIYSIRKSERSWGELRPGEVIYVKNQGTYEIKAIKYLAESNVSAVLLDELETNLSNSLRKFKIPVFNLADYSPMFLNDFLLVDSRIIDNALKEKEKFETKNDIDLSKIIEEYRKVRKKV